MDSTTIFEDAKKQGCIIKNNTFYPSITMQAKFIIESCISELQRTDYISLTYIEGSVNEEVFKSYKKRRQSLRDEINFLEEKNTAELSVLNPLNADNQKFYDAGLELANDFCKHYNSLYSELLATESAQDE
mgnify:CR=1 FL=1|tara:strand:+ start:4343 stop:4735 length:393 start_codon:yes stop_codon:yes gene_type:complete